MSQRLHLIILFTTQRIHCILSYLYTVYILYTIHFCIHMNIYMYMGFHLIILFTTQRVYTQCVLYTVHFCIHLYMNMYTCERIHIKHVHIDIIIIDTKYKCSSNSIMFSYMEHCLPGIFNSKGTNTNVHVAFFKGTVDQIQHTLYI